MMLSLKTRCGLLAVALLCQSAWAWSGAGHMVIAAGAYRQLSPDLQHKVSEILKAHPDYAKWSGSFTPGASDLNLDTYVFLQASTWPDEIRSRHNKYDHSHLANQPHL